MSIQLLDQNTINKIAAGEVVERPMAVVKELVENAIDAGANAITVEIKNGGIDFIRITDNGKGIAKAQIPLAFERHSTSKIKTIEDLFTVTSLGFRGEALSSIAAVAMVELITKTPEELTGARYIMEGGVEKSMEVIGCPNGTTFLVRNLFYNTPARRKFLKTAGTEAGYISDILERFAVSHPKVTFTFLNNNQTKLQTSGNGSIKDIIYYVYGREIAGNLLPVHEIKEEISITGFIGKPVISRGNRNYMNYFINGRYVKSNVIQRAIEDAYKNYSMVHRYPFVVLLFEIDSSRLDVNVHPTKMEVRFTEQDEIYQATYQSIVNAWKDKELIPEVKLTQDAPPSVSHTKEVIPEPIKHTISDSKTTTKPSVMNRSPEPFEYNRMEELKKTLVVKEQIDLFEDKLIQKNKPSEYRIIGQLFSTYWIVEFQDKMFILDQHAAHEKILYEKMIADIKKESMNSQMIQPPIILSLHMREEMVLKQNMSLLQQMGFEIESFGGSDYAVSSVPADLPDIAQEELLREFIDMLVEEDTKSSSRILLEKMASLSCKAAVKANHTLSFLEAQAFLQQLMTLDHPYHCPHGRPTIISMSKKEIEKKFKRIL